MPFYRKKKTMTKKRVGRRRRPTTTLAKQVATLRARMPVPEVKHIDYSNASAELFLGQVNVNANNYYSLDVSPYPAEGTGFSQRIGADICLKKTLLKFQFVGQSSMTTPVKIKMLWVHVKGVPATSAATVVANMFYVNPFICTSGGANAGIIDYNSDFNPDFGSASYKILKQKTISLPMEQFSSGFDVKSIAYPITYGKKGHHVRFNGDGSTLAHGQIILILLADCGNSSTSTGSTLLNIPHAALESGVTFNLYYRHDYTDV
nr:MAG: capsid protein [Cressdnaviricota sp.]